MLYYVALSIGVSLFVATSLILNMSKSLHTRRTVSSQKLEFTKKTMNETVLFITASYGTYEKSLKTPTLQTIPSRFIAFTDQSQLLNSTGWEVYVVEPLQLDILKLEGINSLSNNQHPFNKAKFFKQQFHRLKMLKEYRYIIWMDATIKITNPSTAENVVNLIGSQRRNFILFEHRRGGLMQEEVAASQGSKYLDPHWGCCPQPVQNTTRQYEFYIKEGFQEKWWVNEYDAPIGIYNRAQYGMWVTCFIAFDMTKTDTCAFLDLWWEQNVLFSTQDQVSFPYAAWKLKLYPYSLPDSGIEGNYNKNSLYTKVAHGNKK
jgi:O-antigen biosynthesis protein